MASPLQDLDELVLRCRDFKAQQYIQEAVSSYKAGAHRAAIVATWIAVCFDIIEKLRELALAGDREAEEQVQELERTRRENDLSRALKFERELLANARDKFELISPLEFIDLERLQADRNRCAHPSLTADDQAYAPSAELARLHIHSAVTHVLQHPPVQGKFALDRLTAEVNSDYFPRTKKDALVALQAGPLRRPRESLVRNFLLILIKRILNESLTYQQVARLRAALAASREMHELVFQKVLGERLPSLARVVPDKDLSRVITALNAVDDCWSFMEPDVRRRITSYVEDLPSADFDDTVVEFLLGYQPLQAAIKRRIRKATKEELVSCSFFVTPSEVCDQWISLYLKAASFKEANEFGRHIVRELGDFSREQVERLINESTKNKQITGSVAFEIVISTIRERKMMDEEALNELLKSNGLGNLIESDDPF